MFHCSVILSMQTLGEHELRSNEHLPGDSVGPYPAVNHAGAFPPTTYTSTMGNEGPPYMAIVSIHILLVFMPGPPLLTVTVPKGFGQRQLDADHPTPGITQYIPTDPGPPPLEQYAPAVPASVRVFYPTPLPSLCICSLSYCASNYRRCPTTTRLVTYLFLTMWQDLLEEI